MVIIATGKSDIPLLGLTLSKTTPHLSLRHYAECKKTCFVVSSKTGAWCSCCMGKCGAALGEAEPEDSRVQFAQ